MRLRLSRLSPVRLAILAGLQLLAACAVHAQLSVSPATATVCAGGHLALTANGGAAATASWGVAPTNAGSFDHPASSATTTFTIDAALREGSVVVITAATTPPVQIATSQLTIGPPCSSGHLGGEIARAVVGFEQVGASATASSQSFMFDFFLTRPVPLFGIPPGDNIWGQRLRWWGDVKVSSFPYTQKSSVATVAQQFASTFGNQDLNKLAESIEFVTGPELRLWTTDSHGSLTDSSTAARFGLTWFAGAGAVGPNNPTDNATVFLSPITGTPQDALLRNLFPGAAFTNCTQSSSSSSPCTNYVAFVPRSADRFLQQWGSGFRLYTIYTNKQSGEPSFAAPATVEFSIGQNAAITESHLHHFVFHAAAMYPFPIGPREAPGTLVIYLFGEVSTALSKNQIQNTLTLIPALDSNNNPIPVSAVGVSQIPVEANRRDTYRIGVGVDLVSVWNKLTGSKTSP